MRTVLLIIGTVVVLAAAGGLYVWMQPPALNRPSSRISLTTQPAQPAPRPAAAATAAAGAAQPIVQAGEDVWVKSYDEKTSELASQFRASRYDPQPDGAVNVTRPQAEFYFSGGQFVRIEGTRGRVVMPPDAAAGAESRGQTSPPSRGELSDVSISLFEQEHPERPMLVCRMNNIAFDNDTFRIATEAYTKPDGTVVAADQVPVEVRGDDYDFDGRGLTIRWNDRDRRLQLLEIAHGQSLTIKSPQVIRAVGSPAPAAAGPASQRRRSADRGERRFDAAVNERSPASAAGLPRRPAASSAPATRRSGDVVYRATFLGGVHILQGDQALADADQLRVDFRQGEAQPPTTRPDSRPVAATHAAEGHRASSAPTPAARPAAAKEAHRGRPASSAAEQPLVVKWTGKLVVAPVEKDPPHLDPGQRNYELIGGDRAVTLSRSGSRITCASCVYRQSDGSAFLRSSPAVPLITMTDAAGATVLARAVNYSGPERIAVLPGAGSADVPIRDEERGTTEALHSRWSKSCILTLGGSASQEQLSFERAEIAGDVHVEHPRLKLRADQVEVDFAPAAAGAAADRPGGTTVKDVTATGQVAADFADEQDQQRHITADRLNVVMAADGEGQPPGGSARISPQTFTADGNVHTFDQEQDLRAGHLTARLAPTTRPTDPVQIEELFAQQDVRFELKNGGTSGKADQLSIILHGSGDDADPEVKLSGQPAATVTDGASTLVGPIINFYPRRQVAHVVGAGSLNTIFRENASARAEPLEVTWDSEARVDGAGNRIEVLGNVTATQLASDGSKNITNGRKLTIELMDALPASRPGTHPADPRPAALSGGAASRPAATAPAGRLLSQQSMMAKKTVRTAVLEADTDTAPGPTLPIVQSELFDPASRMLLRRVSVFAPVVRYEAQTGELVIPAAGRMLYEDLRPRPGTQPASGPSAPAATPLGDFRGRTAFEWHRQFSYQRQEDRAEMSGQVVIVHQDSGQGSEPFRLEAARVITEFDASASTAAASAPAVSSPIPSGAKVKRMMAEGGVRFQSRQIQFDAETLGFDPASEILEAVGSETAPVQLYDHNGISAGSFQGIWWNTRTQQIERLKNLQAQIRR